MRRHYTLPSLLASVAACAVIAHSDLATAQPTESATSPSPAAPAADSTAPAPVPTDDAAQAAGTTVSAEATVEAPPTVAVTSSSATVELPAPRELPRDRAQYYRGRSAGTTPGQAALWIPRVVFFPVFLVTEYVIRQPILAIAGFAETNHIPQWVMRVTNPTPDFSWAPTFVADLGLITSGGLQFRWSNFLVHGNELRASGSTGGIDVWHVALRDQVTLGPVNFGILGDFLTRPDRPFYGLFPTSKPYNETRYRLTRTDAFAFLAYQPSNYFRAKFTGGYRRESTGPGWSLNIDTPGYFNAQGVAGYGQTFDLAMGNAMFTFDSRRSATQDSGVRFDLGGTYARDLNDNRRHWIAAELQFSAAIEVMKPNRVLEFSLWGTDTLQLDPAGQIPFIEQPTLGRIRMPGFLWGRFVDRSAIVAEMHYRYPVWEHLDALWTFSTGNVFGEHFFGFAPSRFASSYGIGFQTRFDGRQALQIMAAVGASPFGDPNFGIESFRLHVGVNTGL